jgi:uncharacterized protein (DUF952 family)
MLSVEGQDRFSASETSRELAVVPQRGGIFTRPDYDAQHWNKFLVFIGIASTSLKVQAMTEFIYKLFRKAEWEQAKTSTAFAGSADDLRDGFLHFSTAGQVRRTCDRYFFGENDLVLAAVDASPLGEALKWDVSRGGAKFPHLYRPLNLHEVHSVFEIRRDANGHPIFPPEIP